MRDEGAHVTDACNQRYIVQLPCQNMIVASSSAAALVAGSLAYPYNILNSVPKKFDDFKIQCKLIQHSVRREERAAYSVRFKENRLEARKRVFDSYNTNDCEKLGPKVPALAAVQTIVYI